MRKPVIAGNWKMNNTKAETKALLTALIPLVKDAKCDVVVCTPYTDLDTAVELTKGTNVKVGAENVSWADKGAFTGEISADMLLEIGVEYVVIGHSERRQMFGETDKTVSMRTAQALKKGLTPIVCVGETEAERVGGLTEEVCSRQIKEGLAGLTAEDAAKIIIAYEPVWAIGTGKTATKEDANQTIGYIRSVMGEVFGAEVAEGVVIQYGGSMNAGNCDELMSMPEIDGGLIGGASLKAPDFAKIVASANVKF